MSESEVGQYYDKFSLNVLLNDFRRRNRRQVEIVRLLRKYIPQGVNVLEVGCGAGLISRELCKLSSHLFSVDISSRNIEIAKQYSDHENHSFAVMDACSEPENLGEHAPYDAILIPDVIEHIQIQHHKDLFENLVNMLSENGLIVMTYPSPAYQAYLKRHNPDALQIVDEEIELGKILEYSGLYPVYYSLVDIWQKNQYVHLVLSKNSEYEPVVVCFSMREKILNVMLNIVWRIKNRSFLKKVMDVLSEK